MDADDASPAEMRRPPANRDADRLALDEDTVERLLAGVLPPDRAPAGYARVAQLLAAAVAAPTPEELAGQEAVLAELRAMARARSAAALATGRARPPRRRRRGLAVAIVVSALATGGVAGAATGHLPAPVRDAAQTIIGAGTGTPSSPTTGQPPTSATGTPTAGGAGSTAPRPGAAPSSGPSSGPGSGSGPASTGAGPAAVPALEGLCKAYAAGDAAERERQLNATAFKELVAVAGGKDKVAAFCEDLLPGDQKLKETKKTKPEQFEQPEPSGSGGQGQGDPPSSTGGGGIQGQSGPPLERERAP
jgi:hypothetical protein